MMLIPRPTILLTLIFIGANAQYWNIGPYDTEEQCGPDVSLQNLPGIRREEDERNRLRDARLPLTGAVPQRPIARPRQRRPSRPSVGLPLPPQRSESVFIAQVSNANGQVRSRTKRSRTGEYVGIIIQHSMKLL